MSEVFVPTRYMAYTHAEDGSLILYCSMTGAIGVVPPEKTQFVKGALKRNARHTMPLEGVLENLRHGGFLVPDGTDEMEVLRGRYCAMKDAYTYLNLIIMPTEECNFRCVYCYESFSRGKMSKEIQNGIKQFISGQSHLTHLLINWFGGEPLLAADVIIEMNQFFYQYCSDRGIEYAADITTNGFLLTPDLLSQIVPYGLRSFQVTLDGIPKEHNKHRMLINGRNTFDTIMDNLRYLKSTNYNFVMRLRHNIDPDSFVSIEEFIELLKNEFGGDPRFIVVFRRIGKLGGPNDVAMPVCEGIAAREAVFKANKLAVDAGFRIAWPIVQLSPFNFVCYAAMPRSFVVGSSGTIYKCTVELDSRDRNIIGHLYPDGRMELDQKKMNLWCEKNEIEESKKCSTCFFSPACFGAVCPKQWLDKNDCECPADKMAIASTLKLILKQNRLPLPPFTTLLQKPVT